MKDVVSLILTKSTRAPEYMEQERLYYKGQDVDTLSIEELRKAVKELARINSALRNKLLAYNEEYLIGS